VLISCSSPRPEKSKQRHDSASFKEMSNKGRKFFGSLGNSEIICTDFVIANS